MFVFKSGFIAILGRPNVGKSTFFNAVIGDKISIAADKPQTTRNRISGILNFPDAQMIFLDTPGMHKPKTPLNRAMVKAARDTIGDADLILMMVEADKPVGAHDLFLMEALAGVEAPVFLAINKTDRMEKSLLLPLMDQCRRLYDFAGIFPYQFWVSRLWGLPRSTLAFPLSFVTVALSGNPP